MNRVWYSSLVVFGVGAGFFLGMFGVPHGFAWLNPVMICLIAGLTFGPLVHRHGWHALWIVCMLGLTGCVIEYVAIKTCFPYGCFVYSDMLGYKILDTVPWTVLFAWSPLVVGIWTLFAQIRSTLRPWQFFSLVTLFLVCCDGVLDPGAVHAGFWLFEGTHWWYNVPWTNFAGWVLSGVLGFLEREGWLRWYQNKTGKKWILTESDRYALLVMMVFWTTYAGVVGMWGAAIVGCGVVAVIGYMIRLHKK